MGTEYLDGRPTIGPLLASLNLQNYGATNSFEFLRSFLAENRYVQVDMNSAWNATAVGSGSVAVSSAYEQRLRTGATATSSILNRWNPMFGFNASATFSYVDWSKKASFFFSILSSSDAQAVRRVQFKETNSTTIATLAVRGVGLQLDNLALTGEAYGTSRGTVDLSTTLTASVMYDIEIRLDSTGCEFFVNNVTKGKITTAGLFPTIVATAECDGFTTAANGAAGNNTDFEVGNMAILQNK